MHVLNVACMSDSIKIKKLNTIHRQIRQTVSMKASVEAETSTMNIK